MTLFTNRMRLVASQIACLFALFSASSLSAQSGWQSDCGSGQYELVGAGINAQISYDLAIPDGMSADSIVVEVVGKGVVVPTQCTFSSDSEAAAIEVGIGLIPIGSGSHLTTVFRRTMAAASTITVATDDPANTWSVVAYIYKADDSGVSSVGEFASYYIHRADWTTSYSLAPAISPRDVIVRIPITDLNTDSRVAIVSASAGGVSASETVSISDLGGRLRIVELVLSDVPADATSVQVDVSSPNPASGGPSGDSFVFGIGVSSHCDGACLPPAILSYDYVTPVSPIVTWEDVPGAIRYEVCGRPIGTSDWRCHTRTVNSKRFFNMIPGIGHEIIVRVQCADGSISEYSAADTIYAAPLRESGLLQEVQLSEVYPNPAANEVFIKIDGQQGKTLVQIRDLSGRIVAMQQAGQGEQQLRLDVSSQPSGMYLVHIQDAAGSRTERLLVAH